jgi:hypothetical protein
MNDLEIYIYIALALIYFLSRAFRKKKPAKPPRPTSRTSSEEAYEHPSQKEKPLTFEDLLKEFTGQKNEPVSDVQEEEIEEESYKSLEEEYINSEEQPYSAEYETYDESNYKSYEEVYGEGKHLKTLDEQVQINEPVRKRFDEYKIKEEINIHKASRFRELLRNKDSIKDAIILKEILDRRYFW